MRHRESWTHCISTTSHTVDDGLQLLSGALHFLMHSLRSLCTRNNLAFQIKGPSSSASCYPRPRGAETVAWRSSVKAFSNSDGNGTGANGVTKQRSAGTTMSAAEGPLNVLGTPLQCCCTSPVTGFYRDGFCRTDAADQGRHVVCAQVTQAFLEYSRSQGNDLMTPAPWFNFPGLKDGDKWCLCAARWREAVDAGCAPPVFLKCTHAKALEYVTMQQLKAHALDLDA